LDSDKDSGVEDDVSLDLGVLPADEDANLTCPDAIMVHFDAVRLENEDACRIELALLERNTRRPDVFQIFFPFDAKDEDRKPDIVVDDDKVQCPNAAFTSIQAAVNAANPGDVIRVCPGTYVEQVVVDKSVRLQADNGAIVMPSNMNANTTSAGSGKPLAVVVLVKDATDVNIEGFIVDGTNNGITGCAPTLIGILFQDASGTVKHNAVRHMSLAASLNGCQSGDGIDVISSPDQSSRVTIEDNSVHDYQKNGITGNELGTSVAIQENSVTGIGPTTGAAQNGIQVGFGAQGSVQENSVEESRRNEERQKGT